MVQKYNVTLNGNDNLQLYMYLLSSNNYIAVYLHTQIYFLSLNITYNLHNIN